MSGSGSAVDFTLHGTGAIQSRSETNRILHILNNLRGRGGININKDLNGGLVFDAEELQKTLSDTPVNRLLIEKVSGTSVKVLFGKWTRNGTVASLVGDAAVGTDKTLTGLSAASETYYITVTLTFGAASKDPALIPDTLVASAPTALPADQETTRNISVVIGEVVTSASNIIESITQYWVGDIDDTTYLPDTDSTSVVTSSIELKPDDDFNQMELQIFDFDNPPTADPLIKTTDLFLVREGTNSKVVYVDETNMIDNYLGGSIGDYLNTAGFYWKTGGVHDGTCYGVSIGDSSKAEIINLDNQEFVDNTDDWTFKGAGNDVIIEGDEASTGSGSGALRVAGGIYAGKRCVFNEGGTDGLLDVNDGTYVVHAQFGGGSARIGGKFNAGNGNSVELDNASYSVDAASTVNSENGFSKSGSTPQNFTFQATVNGQTKDITVTGSIITAVG